MPAPAYDTLKLAKALQPSFSLEQAEQLATAFSDNASDQLATKTDLVEMKVEMVRWIVGAIAFNLLGTIGIMLALVRFAAK